MRLVTRSDFDGLACAAILKELGIIDDVFYTHPKDLQDGIIKVNKNDVLANVPYVPGCGLWFDHHSSEHERLELNGKFEGASEPEPSAARVIYNYYKKDTKNTSKLEKFNEMLKAVDYADSAQYTKDDILNPKGWMMLAFICDPRTGLGYYHKYRISNFELMKTLPDLLRAKTVDEILSLSDFKERVEKYTDEMNHYKEFIKKHSRIDENAIIIDLRGLKDFPTGNRFVEYTVFPEQNISIRMVDGKNRETVMISVGHSIINRSSKVDVGSLMLKHGGGGHKKVGTCQVPHDDSFKILKEILKVING